MGSVNIKLLTKIEFSLNCYGYNWFFDKLKKGIME